MALDNIITFLGFGPYQLKNYVLASTLMLMQPFQILILTFIAKRQPFSCKSDISNFSNDLLSKNTTSIFSCFRKNKLNHKFPCNYWYFSNKSESIIAEWNLVCNLEYLVPLASSIFMGGSIVGAVLFSILSDKYGRKTVLGCSVPLYSIISIVASFVSKYYVFVLLRFIQGMAHASNSSIHIVILSELLPKRKRYLAPLLSTINFCIGYGMLAIIAFYIRQWRRLQLITGSIMALLIFNVIFLDESIYWLVDNKRFSRAKRLIQKAARWNSLKLPVNYESEIVTKDLSNQATKTRDAKIIDIFRHPELRRRALLVNFGTFFMAQVYMGMTFSTHVLPGNLYINFALIGLTEMPGKFFALLALKYGRRKPIFILNSISVFFLLISIVSPTLFSKYGKSLNDIINVSVFMAARSFIGCSLAIAYVLISEIYPTSVRSTGSGLNNSLNRTGFLMSPFLAYLNNIHHSLFSILLASFCLVSAVLISYLPPTKDIALPESLDELDESKSYKTKSKFLGMFPSYVSKPSTDEGAGILKGVNETENLSSKSRLLRNGEYPNGSNKKTIEPKVMADYLLNETADNTKEMEPLNQLSLLGDSNKDVKKDDEKCKLRKKFEGNGKLVEGDYCDISIGSNNLTNHNAPHTTKF